MKARCLALASILVVAGMPAVSHAAKKKQPPPVCNLVKDAKGDATPVNSNSMDIVTADIASDAKKLTGVIRLAGWSEAEPTAPIGRVYTLQFEGEGGDTYAFLSYFNTPVGSSFTYGYHDNSTGIDTGAGEATGKVDSAKKEIRITAPISALSANGTGSFKVGKKVSGIQVRVSRWLGAYVDSGTYAGFNQPADSGSADKTYLAGAKSCVKPG